ncbi:hypothetical protein GSI_05337 [Ganoderma sinense ZZ0214-1]|uniref:Hydrophobin n=1 Tax=Ganoderma sinense ZZ0214-1 TaxID=1077348 RepID=A0A2G8SFV5_9APHY|nr:hypothetical protein GSI_05337 [Ganoderma sinense ZZ0214-1]
MSARFAGLAFFALAAVVSASPVPCETTTVTDWNPTPTNPGGPSDPITSLPLPTSSSIPGLPPLSTVDPTSVIPTIPTISIPPVSIPSISVPTISVPTISVPTISVPSISVPTITAPSVTLPSITLPTVTLPTGSAGNAPTDTSSAASGTPTAPSGGDGNGNGNGGGQCDTGAMQCCNTVADSGTPEGQKSILDALGSSASLDLLDIVLSDVNAAVGIECSPINVLSITGSSSCTAQPVCCKNDAQGGLISIGCIPITL